MRIITVGPLVSLLLICSFPSRASESESSQNLQELCARPLGVWCGLTLHNQDGLTMQKFPTLYFYGLYVASVRFTLIDSRSMRPVAEVPVHLLGHTHLQRIPLGDYGLELEPDVEYRWYVSEIWNSDLSMPSETAGEILELDLKLAEGIIVRIDPKHQNNDGRSCERDRIRTLARARIWYDAFSCVIELIEASPDDRTLRDLRDELLGQCRHPYDRMPLGPCILLRRDFP